MCLRLARLALASSSVAFGDYTGLFLYGGLALGQYCGRSLSIEACSAGSGSIWLSHLSCRRASRSSRVLSLLSASRMFGRAAGVGLSLHRISIGIWSLIKVHYLLVPQYSILSLIPLDTKVRSITVFWFPLSHVGSPSSVARLSPHRSSSTSRRSACSENHKYIRHVYLSRLYPSFRCFL